MRLVHKLCYIALGGFLFALGTIISPIIAERTKFSEVECTKLTVVNRDGDPVVVLSAAKGERVDMGNGEIHVYGASHGRTGGSISVHNGQEKDSSLWIHASPDYVALAVKADIGNSALIVSDSRGKSSGGGGRVVVNSKNGSATLEVDEYGGRLDIRDSHNTGLFREDGKPLAIIGINKNGNGVVQTRKKNGEAFHTLGNPVVLPHVGTTSDVN